jgi:hypothetical protein
MDSVKRDVRWLTSEGPSGIESQAQLHRWNYQSRPLDQGYIRADEQSRKMTSMLAWPHTTKLT